MITPLPRSSYFLTMLFGGRVLLIFDFCGLNFQVPAIGLAPCGACADTLTISATITRSKPTIAPRDVVRISTVLPECLESLNRQLFITAPVRPFKAFVPAPGLETETEE